MCAQMTISGLVHENFALIFSGSLLLLLLIRPGSRQTGKEESRQRM